MPRFYRYLLLSGLLGSFPLAAVAQTGIGTTTPGASTRLDIVSGNRGVRLPQVNLTSVTDGTTISLPATSLLIWNTNAALPNGTGYYYNAGTPAAPSWVKLVDSSSGVLTADNGLNKSGSTVKLGGNLTAATTVTNNGNALNFAGSGTTTTFTSAGLVGIGTTSPAQRLHVAGTSGTPNVRLGSLSGTGVRLVTADANGDLSTNTTGAANGMFWGLTGNSGTNSATNFLGTTTAQDLVIRINNTEMARFNPLAPGGQLLLGNNAHNTYLTSVMGTGKIPDTGTYSRLYLLSEGGESDLTMMTTQASNNGIPQLNMGTQGGTTLSSPVALPDGSSLGRIKFWGYNGTASDDALAIEAINSKTTSGNVVSDLMFKSGDTDAERILRLNASRDIEMYGYPNTRNDATTPVNTLYTDAGGAVKSKPVSAMVAAGGAVTTANNGLTKTVNNVQLGGNLAQATTVTNSGFALNVAGSSSTTTFASNGSVGVGVASPNASAVLDVTSSNKGVLLPRIALVSLTDVVTIASPATGLLVYNTTTNLAANLTPGFYYWNGTSWGEIMDNNTAGGSKSQSYAFVGLYADQYINGIDCGEFSFRLRRRTDATNYTLMNENVDAQAKWNGASGSITALTYAETLFAGGHYDFSGTGAFAPTAAPQTGTRSNNVLNAGTWYSWGEPGFAVSAANQEKRQYILTPSGSSAADKYFYRIEFAFLVGNFTACATCNSISNSQEIVNGAKVLILVEKVYN